MSDGALEVAQPHRWSLARVLFLAATGICLYLLAPSIVEVFSAWERLDQFNPIWIIVIIACETASFACIWGLQRIVMPDVGWFDGAMTQLVGNAFNRITPGGGATGTALQARLLADAGHDLTGVATALTTESLMITLAITVLPLFSLPAILLGLNVPGSLADAAWIGVLVFVVVTLAGVWMLRSEQPLCRLGNGLAWIANKLRRRGPQIDGLGERLIIQRDTLRAAVGAEWLVAISAAVGRWVFEYIALLVALNAIGAQPDPTLLLLAFVTAELLGLLPFTPGGLGFVEAGLTGTLALAGVGAADAVLATLVFRLVSFWLPLPVGLAASFAYRRRHPRRESPEADAGTGRSSGHTRPRDR